MKQHYRILAGAGIVLMTMPAPLPALSRDAPPLAAPILLAQSAEQGEQGLKKRKAVPQPERNNPSAEKPSKRERSSAQDREPARQQRAEPGASPAGSEKRVKQRQDREATQQRKAEPKASTASGKERNGQRKQRDAVKQRGTEPKAPESEASDTTAEKRVKPRKEREAEQRDDRPKASTAGAKDRDDRRQQREAAEQRNGTPTAKESAQDAEQRAEQRKERKATEGNRDAAEVFDSAKERPSRRGPAGAEQERTAEDNRGTDRRARTRAARQPESDAAAQAGSWTRPPQIDAIVSEQGRRIDRPRRGRIEMPEGSRVVREVNNRVIYQTNNTYFIEHPREERVIVDAREVYYEELPRSRQREVVVRPDGTRIVTIRNRWGDVVRRVKILPDHREVVLVYVQDDHYDEVLEWRDPGLDLPPLQLDIPARDYVLEAEWVEDSDDYYTFLEQPPVEQVERTYSLAEVRRSARIRDKIRRIDLDFINFEFGSAEIPESEVLKLEGVAEAMQRQLEENPGETFLIEGHTDAVGSDVANLALSDQRAEAVAIALTNVFEIPPENMVTQGYGEQYLKIETPEPERENRRVAIRRITPLVAPVASAE